MSTNDGGPAFPCHNDSDKEYYWIAKGMTLRDWFAGMAMQALVKNMEHSVAAARVIAGDAYHIADRMIDARSHENPYAPCAIRKEEA